VPDSIHQYFDAAPQQGTERLRLWPRPCQQVIEQNDIGGDLLDLIALGLERAFGRRNQEAYYSAASVARSPVLSLTTSLASVFR
jgi:hypothetical protein